MSKPKNGAPPVLAGVCHECRMGFLTVDDADRHFKSLGHRYLNIDLAIAAALPESVWACPGPLFNLGMRWWC